jgi:hypothetical protein
LPSNAAATVSELPFVAHLFQAFQSTVAAAVHTHALVRCAELYALLRLRRERQRSHSIRQDHTHVCIRITHMRQ